MQGDRPGLTYFGRRFYDSMSGVWMSEDPAILEDGDAYLSSDPRHSNAYLFNYNNPLRYVDPDGRFSWEGFTSSISQGWADNGVFGAISGGFGNIGENVSNYMEGRGFKDNREIQRSLVFVGEPESSPGPALFVSGHIQIQNGYGDVLNSWSTNIGGYGKGAIPAGKHAIGSTFTGLKGKRFSGMILRGESSGWFTQVLNTNFPNRSGIGIHPDGNSIGTLGCIAVCDSGHLQLLEALQLNEFSSIDVRY